MIPAWKIKRELARLGNQIRSVPSRLAEPIRVRRYALRRWDMIKPHDGAVPLGQKLCIFLLYQPQELAGSVLETCEFLTQKGYSVLVVANGGLQPDALSALQTRVWRLLERVNFGYDFGGFQDGMLYLVREGVVPDHLIILNDSIWFPMLKSTSAIKDLQQSPHDVTGLLMHKPASNDAIEASARGERSSPLERKRLRAEHIESYLIAVGKPVFLTEIFQAFWRTYVPSSSKYVTIKRGEIGFSKAMAAGGLKVGALSDRIQFCSLVQLQAAEFIEQTLRYAAYSDNDLQQERDQLLAAPRTEGWVADAKAHIVRTATRRRFNASFCWATEQFFGTGFLKKNDGMLFRRSRLRYLEALEAGDLAADNTAAIAEFRQMVKDDLKKTLHLPD